MDRVSLSDWGRASEWCRKVLGDCERVKECLAVVSAYRQAVLRGGRADPEKPSLSLLVWHEEGGLCVEIEVWGYRRQDLASLAGSAVQPTHSRFVMVWTLGKCCGS
ncbi:hypothetical protein [Actinocorallia sp. A-T 12471]|uniref:hypothetical protein n=1 Tax=Actinocorallia sp. A-T 12471 TaxID=3089813 RepID=UPI0029D0DB05|nr:hypothetical protein [Actinocorallia sp. A-T 12471]MDX6738418.1 hypothetical protein [Actinocorallia sp. A-T 12471]